MASVSFFSSYIIYAWRWRYLLRIKGIELPYFRLLGYMLISIFASNFLPTTIGGDLVKIAAVTRDVKDQRGLAAASVVADRLYNLAGMVLLLIPSVWVMAAPLGLFSRAARTGVPMLASIGLLPSIQKILGKMKAIWRSARDWFTNPLTVLISLVLSILSVGFSFGSFWLVLYSLGIQATYGQAMAIATLAYFVALVPVAINGLGIQEGSITFLLTQIGAGTDQAVAAALLIRLVTLAVSLLGGLWLLVGGRDLLAIARQTKPEEQSPTGSVSGT